MLAVIPIRDGSRPQATTTLLGGWGHSEGRGTMSEASRWRQPRRDGAQAVQRSLEDEDFRQRLLADPKGTVEQELGTQAA